MLFEVFNIVSSQRERVNGYRTLHQAEERATEMVFGQGSTPAPALDSNGKRVTATIEQAYIEPAEEGDPLDLEACQKKNFRKINDAKARPGVVKSWQYVAGRLPSKFEDDKFDYKAVRKGTMFKNTSGKQELSELPEMPPRIPAEGTTTVAR